MTTSTYVFDDLAASSSLTDFINYWPPMTPLTPLTPQLVTVELLTSVFDWRLLSPLDAIPTTSTSDFIGGSSNVDPSTMYVTAAATMTAPPPPTRQTGNVSVKNDSSYPVLCDKSLPLVMMTFHNRSISH